MARRTSNSRLVAEYNGRIEQKRLSIFSEMARLLPNPDHHKVAQYVWSVGTIEATDKLNEIRRVNQFARDMAE